MFHPVYISNVLVPFGDKRHDKPLSKGSSTHYALQSNNESSLRLQAHVRSSASYTPSDTWQNRKTCPHT